MKVKDFKNMIDSIDEDIDIQINSISCQFTFEFRDAKKFFEITSIDDLMLLDAESVEIKANKIKLWVK